MIVCPECGGSKGFEKRGDRRCYFELDANLQEDTWSEGDITMDTDDDGREIIYCLACDSELTFNQILPPAGEA